MNKINKISGCITAIVTPFKKGGIDIDGLRRNIEFQIEAGIDGIVPCGSTGEAATLSMSEHKKVVEIVVDAVNGKIPVIAGTGSNSTEEAIELTKHAEDTGADAALLISPYYNKPTQEGLYQHYKKISEVVNIPMILYNIQARTAVNIEPNTIKKLSELSNIIGVKEASGNLNQVSKIIALTKQTKQTEGNENRAEYRKFLIFSGDDSLTLPVMALGGDGVISTTSNIIPKEMSELVKKCLAGDFDGAREIHFKFLPLMDAMFVETNPAPVKFAMNEMGMAAGSLRLPLVEVSFENKEKIRKVLKSFNLI